MTNAIPRLAGACVLALAFAMNASAQPSGGEHDSLPRDAGGHPDIHGIWQVLNTAVWNIEDHSPELGVPAGRSVVEGGRIPYREDAAEQRAQNFANRASEDPEAKCWMAGVPRSNYLPYPFQIVQTPERILMLYEYVHSVRTIYMGSEHPKDPLEALWMGDSRGHWDGDTLVVDVVNLTGNTWLDRSGNFYSENVHIVERYTPIDADHMRYEATIEDPSVYTRPWKLGMTLYRHVEPDAGLLEYECYAYLEAARPAPKPKPQDTSAP